MTTKEINKELNDNFNDIKSWVMKEGLQKWEYAPKGKWTVGQHIVHLIQSTQALIKGLSVPKFVLNYKFGKCNRQSRDFETVINRYNQKLNQMTQDTVAPTSLNMPEVVLNERDLYLNKLNKLNLKLCAKSNRIKERALDECLLPHPLMGRMTLREILMWNAYHTKHHLLVLEDKY